MFIRRTTTQRDLRTQLHRLRIYGLLRQAVLRPDGRLFDRTSNFIAYGHPTATHGTFGFSYLSLSLADLYSESTMALHYALSRWVTDGIWAEASSCSKNLLVPDTYTANAINSDTGASLGGPDPLFAKNGSSEIDREL